MSPLKLGTERSFPGVVTRTDRISLYDRYGSMAYGVILQIIPESELAQHVLVDLFASPEMDACAKSSAGSACSIIRLARAKALEARANSGQHASSSSRPVANDMSAKRVFELSFYQGHKPETIAEQLNIPYTNVLKAIRGYFQYLRTF